MSDTVDNARVVLRPLGNPLPLGFLGQFVSTVSFSALQLRWIGPGQGHTVALAALILTVPLQLVASGLGFLARDPVAGTGMGVLAGSWGAVALTTLTTAPGTTSPGLGVVLLAAATAMLVPATGGRAKRVAAGVMAVSAVRFAVTGVAELTGSSTWLAAAGWVGLGLGALSLYAAAAFELEGTEEREVLPLGRHGAARTAARAGEEAQLRGIADEPGVRKQL
jgi:succinate-acetate transporter protein